jgi:RNA polymerase sigma factor (sigma-70 family)
VLNDAEVIGLSVDEPHLFEQIFERHYGAILRYGRQRAGHDVGEEIASRTMVIAFERRASYDVRHPSARAWLYGIATNLIRHYARDERVHMAALAKLPIDPEIDDLADADRLDAERARPALLEALQALPARDRDAFVLLSIADLTYPEIARALDVPVGTVRSRIHRARRSLRERLASFEANTDVQRERGRGRAGDDDA